MIKISKNVGQRLIRMEEILNIEATQILNYLADLELNGFLTEPGIFGRRIEDKIGKGQLSFMPQFHNTIIV